MRIKPTYNNITLLLLVVIMFLLIVHVYSTYNMSNILSSSNKTQTSERFNNSDLLPKDKLVVIQGNSLPGLDEVKPIEFDEHESLPTVDGTTDGPRSMFALAFNKCDPSCCPSTYSCGGGCVCMTKDQQNFIGSRGFNNKTCKSNTSDTEY